MASVLLTFDVEDWFQAENLRPRYPHSRWDTVPRRVGSSTRAILRLLEEHRIPATFFILGWIAEREPDLVREIARAGHEVACHGYHHVLPMQLTPHEFREDVLAARRLLEDLSGMPVKGFRAPSFNIDGARLTILAENGFEYDSSHHPVSWHRRYGRLRDLGTSIAPDVYRLGSGLVEVGLPVEQFGRLAVPVSGGGYFRLYPGAVFRRLARRAIARRGHYVMYLHSWEFDPDQPRVRGTSIGATFRHYVNLRRTTPRFRRLVEALRADGGRFMPLRQFVQEINGLRSPERHPGRPLPRAGSSWAAGMVEFEGPSTLV